MSQPKGPTLVASIAALIALTLVVALTLKRFPGDSPPPASGVVAAPSVPGETVATAGKPGEATYTRLCSACHGSGAAGAPILGQKEAWEPRIARGMDALLQTVIAGKGAMPPRGTCGGCSDADLKSAIAYMVSRAE